MIPKQLVSIVRETGHFILVTHVRPDGDALGSLFGLAEILTSFGKKVFCYFEEPLPPSWNFLPGRGRANSDLSSLRQFIEEGCDDIAVISLDCGSAERLGKNKDELLAIKPFLVIDHHFGHQTYSENLWLEPNCSSTGEMVYKLAVELGAEISSECANDLYVAISTDTGSFRYDSTTAETMRSAADLLDRGVKPADVASSLYDNYSVERLQLMEKVLSTLQLHASQQLAVIHVTREMFAATGASDSDIEGFVNYPRSLGTVEVAVFLKEGTDDVISVSLRAKGKCDVAEIAARFGGGGHRNAAGCRFFSSSIEQARGELLPVLQDALLQ